MNLPSLRTEPELAQLQRKAEQYASGRRERLTSAHLLAAIADDMTAAARLLRERNLTTEQLLKAARSSTDDAGDPLAEALDGAREFAGRMRSPEPSALHVLVALLSERRSAAYRVLDQFGVDVPRLRLAAMNLGLGQPPLRAAEEPPPPSVTSPREPGMRRTSRAVSVPLMQQPLAPKANSARATAPQAPNSNRSQQPGRVAPLRGGAPARTTGKARGAIAPHLRAAHAKAESARSKTSAGGEAQRSEQHKVTPPPEAALRLDPERFKLLTSLGRNISLLAATAQLEAPVGREREVERVLDVLAKHSTNSACLVGPAGVGKTSVVVALALRSLESSSLASESAAADARRSGANPPEPRIVIELPVAELLSGTGVRGALSERFTELLKELKAAAGRVVLVIEDLPQLFAGDAAGELGSVLRRALAEGEFTCIGTATPEDYQRVVEADAALDRRFVRLDVEQPPLEDAVRILERHAALLTRHHQICYEPQALRCAVAWSARYVTGRALPDKAIGIADLAGARAKRRGQSAVTPVQIADVVAELASVPAERLLETDSAHLLQLEEHLAQRVVGHREALAKIARIVRRNAAGLGSSRPIGTFLLLGPSGVGKTETAKALAEALFGTEQALTRIDLSEYSEAHAVARLLGAPPGYVGHEAGGQLTEAVRRRPYQVLLLDEIEKAHLDVLQAFLPLLDEGRLTDGRGRTVDFTNTVIVLTSNLGAREASGSSERGMGFVTPRATAPAPQSRALDSARQAMPPEFWNRLDETLVFAALSREEVQEVARRMLQQLADRVFEQREVALEIQPSVVEQLLAEGGFDLQLGARPMRRAIARLIEGPLAECLLRGDCVPGSHVVISVEDAAIQFTLVAAAAQ